MNLTTFTYSNQTIRVITDSNGSPWFVLSDICAALELSNKDTTILEGFEKSVVSIRAFGVKHKIKVINNSGLYTLIYNSDSQESINFKKLVNSEVMPSINKQRSYKAPFNEVAAGLEVIYRSLNLSESEKLNLLKGLAEDYGVPIKHLPI